MKASVLPDPVGESKTTSALELHGIQLGNIQFCQYIFLIFNRLKITEFVSAR